jgi:zinc/manganese transport system permease protein
MDVFWFLLPPLAACLVLTGIHVYLGLHIVSRGVIFVDLALAQVAALGATAAALFGHDLHGGAAYAWSLGAAFLGAVVLAFTRARRERVPQEAFIGVVYVVSAAAAILVLQQVPQGGEHIKDMLVGNILAVSWLDTGVTAALYVAVGAFHWVFRKKFFLITLEPERAYREGLALRWWDFLFYASLGVVVTWSVAMVGVLMVFSYLVIPAAAASLLTERAGPRLVLGWLIGALASSLGIAASFFFDLPTGATIVCVFGATLAALVPWSLWRKG